MFIRDIRNKSFSILEIMNLYSKITLLSNIDMDIDDFGSRNAINYDDVRGHTMTSNKISFRTVSMFLSKILVDYATRIE